MTGRDQDPGRTDREREFQVGALVADHERVFEAEAEVSGGAVRQSASRLAAPAALLRRMRTQIPRGQNDAVLTKDGIDAFVDRNRRV